MLNNGEGKQTTATSTTALWTPTKSGANSMSVDVEGTDPVFCLVNCTAAEFNTAYAAGSTIKVRNGVQFGFYGDQFTNIRSICYRTETNDSAVNFAAY